MEEGLNRNKIITELSKSAHGDLKEYFPVGKRAAAEQAEFFAHLIAWDRFKGQVRDAKIALPLVSLTVSSYPEEFVENSLAHLMLLGPRELLRAMRFALDNRGYGFAPKRFAKLIGINLLEREKNWPKWERTMLQHRETFRELFGLVHAKPNDDRTHACLWRCKGKKKRGDYMKLTYPAGGLFEIVSQLKHMSPLEAAGTIIQKGIPFLVAQGALGASITNPDIVLALIKSMTATELTTNVHMLEKMGMKTNPVLRGAFQEAIEKASKSTANVLKATVAVEALDDEELKETMRGLQEKQKSKFSTVDGGWIVLADRSPSMVYSIEVAKEVAATLASMTKEKVWLVFFDSQPQGVDVTGASLDAIKKATQYVNCNGGGTSIGCGLTYMISRGFIADGIVIVTDGGQNTAPTFPDAYKQYTQFAGKEVPVYVYLTRGDDPDKLLVPSNAVGLDLQVFDLREQVKMDHYSLPNLVRTMRTNKYALADEILATRLLKLPEVYKDSVRTARV